MAEHQDGPPRIPGLDGIELPEEAPILRPLDPGVARWLFDQTARLEGDDCFRRARETILGKRKDWLREHDFADIFTILAVVAVQRRGLSRQVREQIWSLGTGKTWKSLKDFPARLRSIASEAEQVSKGVWLNPQTQIGDDTPERRHVKKRFRLLPGVMRLFAVFVESGIARLPQTTAADFPPASRSHSRYVLQLSCLVEALTGRYRDPEVVELLNAAAEALGSKTSFDTQTLADQRQAAKRKNKSAFYSE